MQVIKESGHWYSQVGAPAYTTVYADPKRGWRNTTLRDAKKLDLVPSVTTILQMLPKPGLVNWKQEQLFYAALTLTREESESDQQFYNRVVADSKEQARKAAEKGTAIHGAIQRAIQGQALHFWPARDLGYKKYVDAVMGWLNKEFGKAQWMSERTFAHPLGFGGAVDLHNPQVIIDFKTKDFDQSDIDNGKVKGWPEQGMQLAAYREGVGHPKAKRINLFISRNNPGLIHPYYWQEKYYLNPEECELTKKEIARGIAYNHWETFKAALYLWKLIKGYDSSFEGEV